ncbi:phosphotransferase [Parasedimentitalea maritima]|uniref:phosphotransferase n=1 Tax=Parasedimentitalea maritima TaxID=2578117 RepID=UPI001484D78E|nr:phosphotransferase [Zongyanglinia marina]
MIRLSSVKIQPEEIANFCREFFNREVSGVEYPAGKDRKTVIVHLPDRSIVVSKRASASRAKLEASVLEKLSSTGFVPSLVGRRRDILAQELICGNRLSHELERAYANNRERLLIQSGSTLLDLQEAGKQVGLNKYAPLIGDRDGWFLDFAKSPLRLAKLVNAPVPNYDAEALAKRISPKDLTFVKWDARPGNALFTPKGKVSWFDWEHCGCGSPEDDLVWLLADEWTPINKPAEEFLLQKIAQENSSSLDELSARFRSKAILHSAVRLALIFSRKGSGPWWNVKSAMMADRVGVSLPHVRRLCRRASGWSASLEGSVNLAELFTATEEYASSL